jgi:hypothetical protein
MAGKNQAGPRVGDVAALAAAAKPVAGVGCAFVE